MDQESSVADSDRRFEVVVTPCIVTRQFDRCIRVQLGRVHVDDDREAVVVGAFSRAGLEALLADLDTVPDPVGLLTPDEVRENALYMWAAVCKDGTSRQQYLPDGSEQLFSSVHLPDIEEFWVIPRHAPDQLPWYGLIAGAGFVRRHGLEGELEPLPLPFPVNQPWDWQYYRNITIHFAATCGQTDLLPPHVVQVLGWRIGMTLFEIGIEEDGNYQVFKMEPKEHSLFDEFNQQEMELPQLPLHSRLQL